MHRQRYSTLNARLVCFVASIALLPAIAAAKDSPEVTLIQEGRFFEAILLLEAKPKDLAAQKQAAELCLKLALYERAAERLLASGLSREDALATVIDSAVSQGHPITAIRLAEVAGSEVLKATKAKVSRFELAEGRISSALEYAQESGDEALVLKARNALFEGLRGAQPFVLPTRTGIADRIVFNRDGRYILVWDSESCSCLEVLPARTDRSPGRIASPGKAISSFRLSDDGRFLWIWTIAQDGKRTINEFRLERLDSGLEVCTAVYDYKQGKSYIISKKNDKGPAITVNALTALIGLVFPDAKSFNFPQPRLYDETGWRKGKDTGIAPNSIARSRSGGNMVVPSSSFSFFKVKMSDTEAQTSPIPHPLDGFSPLGYFDAQAAAFSPDESRLGIVAKGEGPVKINETMLRYPETNAAPGVFILPYPFLDRETRTVTLARELGRGDELTPFFDDLIKGEEYGRARKLMELAGIDDATLYIRIDKARLKSDGVRFVISDLLQAGKSGHLADEVDWLSANIPEKDFRWYSEDMAKLNALAGRDERDSLLAAAKKAEAAGNLADAALLYEKAGVMAELERLAFADAALFDESLGKIQEWCYYAGKKAGLSEAVIDARIARELEARKNWPALVELYAKNNDPQNFRRVVNAELAGKAGISGRSLELVIAGKDVTLCKAIASSLAKEGSTEKAILLLEAAGDEAGVVGVADMAYDRGDILAANDVYKKYGTKSARATGAARLDLVFGQLNEPLRVARITFSPELVERINKGDLAPNWPIPDAKLADSGYMKLKKLGEDILALPSKPSSLEAKKCAVCMGFVAETDRKLGDFAQASLDANIGEWFSFASQLLKAMGR